ncbi:MAG: LytTR family DNA-binding domain-containing protein [Eubacteriales bacterium]|nr:LytTR family DNA-binding domain-containing protein [Eubacteriales bacterium]MDD3349774.1 LytTR family DNA-binding domain-containing protein [Eubacteriales bacterium]
MKIAVCDDDNRDLLQIVSLLEAYRHDRKADFSYVSFQNATELLTSMGGRNYDLLLLDVLMPGINGIQAAREIREHNSRTEIIFLTSSPEFAVESYSVRAHYYLLKPASEEKLFPILDKLTADLKRPEDALHIKTQTSVFTLPYAKIEYIEVSAKKLYFYLTDGTYREIPGRLSDFERPLLKRPGFVKVHRSYIVNLQWVGELRQGELVTAAGRRVPVARTTYPQVRTAYTQFLFEEAEELTTQRGEDTKC